MTQLTIVVHGTGGTQGAAIARTLAAAGHSVRPLSRSVADATDRAALTRVYAGADAVVASLPLVFSARALAMAEAIVGALADAGISRAVVNPNGPHSPVLTGMPFLDARLRLIEQARATGVATTVVRPAAGYMENFAAPWSAPRILEQGIVGYPLPADLAAPWVALDDVGAAIGQALATAAPPAELVVAGAALTGPQVAAELSAALGRDVRWETLRAADYGRMLQPHLGDEAAEGVAGIYAAMDEQPAPPAPLPDGAVLVQGATALRDWARRHLVVAIAA